MVGEILLFANNRIFEPLLQRLEVRAGELDSRRNLGFWFRFYLQVLLTLLVCYLMVWLLSFITAMVPPFLDPLLDNIPTLKPLFQEAAHTFHVLFAWSPFLFTIIVSCAKVRTSYREAKDSSASETQALNQVRQEIKSANEQFPEMLVSSIEKVADHGPIKTIVEALNPTNEQLQSVIRQVTEDTVSRMNLLRNLLLLPKRARDSLEKITDLSHKRGGRAEGDDDAPHWSDLYISFAITMQMEPWQSAFKDEKFVFVRDIEELRCFHADPNRLRLAFQEQLHKDFIEMLNLVNGRLTSVMYRDISAWRDPRYYTENAKLLERKIRSSSAEGLKRLFVIDDSWKSSSADGVNENLVSAIMGAIWHDEKKYDSRFVSAQSAGTALVPEDESFLASCVLNDTVIAMHAKYEPQPPGKTAREFERYIYKCDSDKRFVEEYGYAFSKAWFASGAQTPDKFIEAYTASHPKEYEVARQNYSLIHSQPKPTSDPPNTAVKRPKGLNRQKGK